MNRQRNRITIYDQMGLPILSVRKAKLSSKYLRKALAFAQMYGRAWKEAFPFESLLWGSEE